MENNSLDEKMQKIIEDFMESFNFILMYPNKNLRSWIKIQDKKGKKRVSENGM